MSAAVAAMPVPLVRLIADAAAQDVQFWESMPGKWAQRQARLSRRLAREWAERADAAEDEQVDDGMSETVRVVSLTPRPDEVSQVPTVPPGWLVHSACDADLRTRSAEHADLASRITVGVGGAG